MMEYIQPEKYKTYATVKVVDVVDKDGIPFEEYKREELQDGSTLSYRMYTEQRGNAEVMHFRKVKLSSSSRVESIKTEDSELFREVSSLIEKTSTRDKLEHLIDVLNELASKAEHKLHNEFLDG